MMNLKFTFQDGSEALAHHGVRGMKWGVWNEETKARRLGSRTGIKPMSSIEKQQASYAVQTIKELRKARKKSDFDGVNVKLTNEVHERLVDARQKLNDSDPLGQKYYSDPSLQKQYKIKYAEMLGKKYGTDTDEYRYGVLFDDLDQGSLSAFSFESSYDLYVKDHVKDSKAYFAKQFAAEEEYRKAVKDEVAKVLGPYSDITYHVNPSGLPGDTIADSVYYQSLGRASDERSQSRKYYDAYKDTEERKKTLGW